MTETKGAAAVSAITDRIKRAMHEAARPQLLRPLGEKAIEIIVRRTRLGYGASAHGMERFKLAPLSNGYVFFRDQVSVGEATFAGGLGLSDMTAPRKSNLTATGQMLGSMAIIEVRQGSVVIGPTGTRADGLTNMEVAQLVSGKRPFNFLTRLEQEQLVRFYRNRFGDLLKNRRLKP